MPHFLITTRGKTGSFWMANALDIHPDIICSHSTIYAPASEIYLSGWVGHNMIGAAWQGKEPSRAYAEALTKMYGRAEEEEKKYFSSRSLLEFFCLQEGMGNAKYYGNVHAFMVEMVIDRLARYQKDVPNGSFKIANLTRHPIKIMESCLERSRSFKDKKIGALERERIINRCAQPIKKYNLKTDRLVLSFICNCNILVDYINPMRYPGLFHIPIERITRDKEYFCFVVKSLTSDDIELSDEYLDKVFAIGKLNRHNRKNDCDDSPVSLFAKWEPWQREYISQILGPFRDVFPKAEELGYDFSMF